MGWIPFRDSFIQIIHDQTTTKERKKKKIWHFYQSRKRIESNLCRTPKRNEKENLLALCSSVVVFDEFEMIRRKRTMELGQERRRENETKGISWSCKFNCLNLKACRGPVRRKERKTKLNKRPLFAGTANQIADEGLIRRVSGLQKKVSLYN